MKGRRVLVLAVCAVTAMSFVTITDVDGSDWTSPGTGQSYTLSWLADNTDAVSEGQEQDVYFLEYDVTISTTDELTIDGGEYLYIYPEACLTVDGDFYVTGTANDKAYITTSNGVRPQDVNMVWTYDAANQNEFEIDYLHTMFVYWDVTDPQGTHYQFQGGYLTEDEVPHEVAGQFIATDITIPSPQPSYAVKIDYLWDHAASSNFLDQFDTDDDGMPNWWEDINEFDKNDDSDASLDEDGDDLTNLREFQYRTNPGKVDTDGDGLEDGPEVDGNGGTYDYTSNPRKQNSDEDSILDDDEIDSDGDPDDYETNPMNRDTDGDTLDDDDEQDDDLDPTDRDTDGDHFDDNRDTEPKKVNRKFAYILEVNDYHNSGPTGVDDDLELNCWEVVNWFDAWFFDTYFYTDHDYDNDGNGNNDLSPGVTATVYDYIDTGNFEDSIDDFHDEVGTTPQGNGDDVICFYIDAWGSTSGTAFTMPFPIANQQRTDTTANSWRSETYLENQLNAMGSKVDLIWVHTPDCSGWEPGIGSVQDGLDAGSRNVVTTDDDIDDDHDVFSDFRANYDGDENAGVKSAFDSITSKDDHVFTDKYTSLDTSVKFYLD